ncbi:MAG: glycosyl transferase family 28 [Proteobacteria bacterium]|nr:glycosyl transferase family 28 [Pseudomonadota bacterium]
MKKILIHVQHLLGTGHARRMAAIAAACAAEGHDVVLASGGLPLKLATGKARLVQLPALRATDAGFAALVDDGDRPIDTAWYRRRTAATLEIFDSFRPDLLVVELYPFGRSMLRFELEPLLERARDIARLCSLRDVLQRPDPPKATARVAAAGIFDAILVHGDPALLPLPESWPECATLGDRLHYTGYVPGDPGGPAKGRDEIVVSVGGGAAGKHLLAAASALAARRAHAGERWRIRTGDAGPAAAHANPHVVVEANAPDFPDLLAHARVSVSQAGYNTCVDLLRARCRSVLVPFAQGKEREQTIRAEAFVRHGWAALAREDALSPELLEAAIDSAPVPPAHRIACDGAVQTAKLVARWL